MVLGKPSAFLVVFVVERLDRISSANKEFGIEGALELGRAFGLP